MSDVGYNIWVLCMGLSVLPAMLGLALVSMVLMMPIGPVLKLSDFPSIMWLYAQVIYSACTKTKSAVATQQLPASIEVELGHPTAFDIRRLAAFLRLVGHKALPVSEVPIMYPVAESFRLCIQAMVMPQFPLGVLGSVLARNRTEVYRALRPDDKLTYKYRVAPYLRFTAKGDTEADLIGTATRRGGEELVWKSTLTVIFLGKDRNKAAAVPAPPGEEDKVEQRQIDAWKLDGSVGRQYGFINGDLNPIHVHALTSRMFGFKRPIAHALFLVAKAEASLRNHGVSTVYPCVMQTEFKRPTLLPAKLAVTCQGPRSTDLAITPEGLRFAVVTCDNPPKDVIVGKLVQGPATGLRQTAKA